MTKSEILDRIYEIPEPSKVQLEALISEVSFPKGHILLRADHIEKRIFFIKKGVARAFTSAADQNVTFWFGEEGDPVLSMRSYVEGKRAYENIELLEACQLYELKTDSLDMLYSQDVHIANWGRKLAEQELLKLETRLITTELLSAKQRYDAFMQASPSLLQRVALKHIASYLGMTQVSLSRIRHVR